MPALDIIAIAMVLYGLIGLPLLPAMVSAFPGKGRAFQLYFSFLFGTFLALAVLFLLILAGLFTPWVHLPIFLLSAAALDFLAYAKFGKPKLSRRRLGIPVAAAALLTLALALWMRLNQPVSSLQLGTGDPYIHVFMLKAFAAGDYFGAFVPSYPRGLHALLTMVTWYTGAGAYTVVRFTGPLLGLGMVLGVYVLGSTLKGRKAGLLSALAYSGLVFPFLVTSIDRQTMTITESLGGLFIPGLAVLAYYILSGMKAGKTPKRHVLGFVLLTLTLALVHPSSMLAASYFTFLLFMLALVLWKEVRSLKLFVSVGVILSLGMLIVWLYYKFVYAFYDFSFTIGIDQPGRDASTILAIVYPQRIDHQFTEYFVQVMAALCLAVFTFLGGLYKKRLEWAFIGGIAVLFIYGSITGTLIIYSSAGRAKTYCGIAIALLFGCGAALYSDPGRLRRVLADLYPSLKLFARPGRGVRALYYALPLGAAAFFLGDGFLNYLDMGPRVPMAIGLTLAVFIISYVLAWALNRHEDGISLPDPRRRWRTTKVSHRRFSRMAIPLLFAFLVVVPAVFEPAGVEHFGHEETTELAFRLKEEFPQHQLFVYAPLYQVGAILYPDAGVIRLDALYDENASSYLPPRDYTIIIIEKHVPYAGDENVYRARVGRNEYAAQWVEDYSAVHDRPKLYYDGDDIVAHLIER